MRKDDGSMPPLFLLPSTATEAFTCNQDAGKHLGPAAGRSAEVDDSGDVFKEVEVLVELNELEGGACTPALFFGEAVVGISFVFGGLAHGDCAKMAVRGDSQNSTSKGVIVCTVRSVRCYIGFRLCWVRTTAPLPLARQGSGIGESGVRRKA